MQSAVPDPAEVHVVRRNLRWEVRVNGIARPMIDWLCTKERAIEHAIERAHEVDATLVVIEANDWTIEDIIRVERASGRYALVA
ncbi:MAG: hypothetical protein ACLQVI_42380 [Polyangiaceae bacterium]|jgi:hypothetical protein